MMMLQNVESKIKTTACILMKKYLCFEHYNDRSFILGNLQLNIKHYLSVVIPKENGRSQGLDSYLIFCN